MRNEENFQPLRKPRRAPRSEAVKRIQRNNALGQARAHAKDVGCVKMTWTSKADAEAYITRAKASSGGKVRLHHSYRCPYCDAFHVTSVTHRFRMRIE